MFLRLIVLVLLHEVRVEPGPRTGIVVFSALERKGDTFVGTPAHGIPAHVGTEMSLRHEDDGELQTLRSVDGHQLHGVRSIEHRRALSCDEIIPTLFEIVDHLRQCVAGEPAALPFCPARISPDSLGTRQSALLQSA